MHRIRAWGKGYRILNAKPFPGFPTLSSCSLRGWVRVGRQQFGENRCAVGIANTRPSLHSRPRLLPDTNLDPNPSNTRDLKPTGWQECSTNQYIEHKALRAQFGQKSVDVRGIARVPSVEGLNSILPENGAPSLGFALRFEL